MAAFDIMHLAVWGHGFDLQIDRLCTFFSCVSPRLWSGRLMLSLASSALNLELMASEVYPVAVS